MILNYTPVSSAFIKSFADENVYYSNALAEPMHPLLPLNFKNREM